VTALKSQVYGPSLTIADKIVDTYEKFDQSSGSEGGSKWIDVL
jgi:hypothetical protein